MRSAPTPTSRVSAARSSRCSPRATSVEQAAQLAVRLERNLCETGSLVTFGWSAYPREGENALTLYRAADERLYGRRVLRERRVSASSTSRASSSPPDSSATERG